MCYQALSWRAYYPLYYFFDLTYLLLLTSPHFTEENTEAQKHFSSQLPKNRVRHKPRPTSLESHSPWLSFKRDLVKRGLGNFYQNYFTIAWLWRMLIASNHPVTADWNYASFEAAERNDSFLIRYGNDLFWGRAIVRARGTQHLADEEGMPGTGTAKHMCLDPTFSKKNRTEEEIILCLTPEISGTND